MESTASPRSRRDVFAGLLFILIAAAFAAEGMNYPMGTLRSMGPGYVPISLAVLLAALGVGIAAAGILQPAPRSESPAVPWRAIVLIVVSLVFFGYFARSLGLVPCVFVCGTLTALGSERNGPLSALILGVVLSAMCYLIFKQGLGLPIPTYGPLVAPYLDPLFSGAPAVPTAPAPAPAAPPAAN